MIKLFPEREMPLFIEFVNTHDISQGSYADAYMKFKQKQKTLNIYKP